MIALLLAVALHATPPETFFCDDRHLALHDNGRGQVIARRETQQECIRRTRRWICSPEDVGDENETDALYAWTIREERRLVCHNRRR